MGGDGAPRRQMAMLAVLALPWLLGPFMTADGERASLAGIDAPSCPSRLVLPEAGCPGCGLTRSTVLVLHGEWALAWAVHPGGWLVLGLTLGGLLIRGDILRRGRMSPAHRHVLAWGRGAFAAGILVGWIGRLLGVGASI